MQMSSSKKIVKQIQIYNMEKIIKTKNVHIHNNRR